MAAPTRRDGALESSGTRSETGAGLRTTLRPVAPFDFSLALAYLGRSPHEPLDLTAALSWRRAVDLGTGPVLLTVRADGATEALAIELDGPGASSPALAAAHELVRRCLRTDLDPAGFATVARGDPVLNRLASRLRGVRPLLLPTPFEALVWAIIGQQINVAFAYRLKRTLVEAFGPTVAVDGRVYRLFPSPERLAALAPGDLTSRQFSRQKAEYIIGLAREVASGALDLAGLASATTEEAIRRLTAVRGVGRWTAEYVCMRGLGHLDVIPAADLGLRAVVGRWYGLGRPVGEAELRELAERWRPFRSWAAFLWWYAIAPGAPGEAAPGPPTG